MQSTNFFKKLFFETESVVRIRKIKQSSGGVLQKRCSYKFRKIHRKIPVPESLIFVPENLIKFFLLKKRLWYKCFPVNFAKFLRTLFFTGHLWWVLLKINVTINCNTIYSIN